MGKKYIIELCEKPMKNESGNDIWRVKGFNTLMFDQNHSKITKRVWI